MGMQRHWCSMVWSERKEPSQHRSVQWNLSFNVPPWPRLHLQLPDKLVSYISAGCWHSHAGENLLINAWAYRLLLSQLPWSFSCFPHNCINIPHWVYCCGDRLSPYAFVKPFELSCIVFTYCTCTGLKLYFNKPPSGTLICVRGLIKREESKCCRHPGYVMW